MPELPEVETTCRGIEPHIVNRTIKSVTIRQNQLRWPITKGFKRTLQDQKILNIERRAKYILVNCTNGTIILHLGMSGRLSIIGANSKAANNPEKHDHVDIALSNNKILRYNDARRFGSIHYTKDNPLEHKLLSHLGPEPLESEFNSTFLFNLVQKAKTPIKTFLMNAKNVVGVGNIYANEALFYSKISPLREAKTISLIETKLLVKNIKKILKQAIKMGGTTLKDFLHADGSKGYFSQTLSVYGQGGKACKLCQTILTEIRLGQRTTVYCSSCQE